jgi:uncharacterized membrane protein YagU involved in acid resistance
VRISPTRLIEGGIAGLVATAPMTLLMEAGHRLLPPSQQYPLPPRQIVERLAEEADAPLPPREEQRVSLTLAAHFGYGAAMGVLYGVASPPTLRAGALRGMLFGSAVWAGSYLGLLPALHVLRPATQHPGQRTLLMILAHFVWGAATGMATYWMRSTRRQERRALLRR